MLLASIIVSSLLFTVVVVTIILFTGAEKSANSLVKEANGGRYLVKTTPITAGGAVPGFDAVNLTSKNIATIRAFESNYYARLKAEYDKIGLKYIEPDSGDSLLTPNAFADTSVPSDMRYRLNFSSSLMPLFEQEQVIDYASKATNTVSHLKKIANKYGGTGYYRTGESPLPSIPNQLLILNHKESTNDRSLKSGDASSYGYSTNAIHNSMYELQDKSLLTRYARASDLRNLKGIPVIVTPQEAASLFGKQFGIGDAPQEEIAKRAWIKKVQDKLTGFTYQTCYRNQVEQSMIEKIQQDYTDTEANKTNKEYVKPSLIYALPSSACGNITVKSDTRTAAEKTTTIDQDNIKKKLGTYQTPFHKIITYQIVGFIEATPLGDANKSAESYIKKLLSYQSDLMGAIIPTQGYQSMNDETKGVTNTSSNDKYNTALEALSPRIVAFNSIQQARNFLDNETCPIGDAQCKKLFNANQYGSSYLIIDDIGKLFSKLMLYILPLTTILAILILWFTMSRVMHDNRKETAIYRAMGARRKDIAMIYLYYTIVIALYVAFSSLTMGIIISFIIDKTYGQQLSAIASMSFGVNNKGTTLTLFDLSSPMLIYIFLTIIVVCLISVAQPLLRNVLRPPIQDMRVE